MSEKSKEIVITGKNICMTVGVLSAICAFYWLIRWLFFDNLNLLMLFISIGATAGGMWYGSKK